MKEEQFYDVMAVMARDRANALYRCKDQASYGEVKQILAALGAAEMQLAIKWAERAKKMRALEEPLGAK